MNKYIIKWTDHTGTHTTCFVGQLRDAIVYVGRLDAIIYNERGTRVDKGV